MIENKRWSQGCSMRERLRSGELIVTSDCFNLGLYSECTCDEENLDEGLLMNETLLAVSTCDTCNLGLMLTVSF